MSLRTRVILFLLRLYQHVGISESHSRAGIGTPKQFVCVFYGDPISCCAANQNEWTVRWGIPTKGVIMFP